MVKTYPKNNSPYCNFYPSKESHTQYDNHVLFSIVNFEFQE